MSELQRYSMEEDYVGASMEKDDYGDWADADEAEALIASLRARVAELEADAVRSCDLHRRSLQIIIEAIMHGMKVTTEVADVRNQVVALLSASKGDTDVQT